MVAARDDAPLRRDVGDHGADTVIAVSTSAVASEAGRIGVQWNGVETSSSIACSAPRPLAISTARSMARRRRRRRPDRACFGGDRECAGCRQRGVLA